MTMEALGRQYAAEADTLAGLIPACQRRKRAAMRDGNKAEAKRQDRLAEQYTQQQNDLLKLSAWLRHYYNEPDNESLREEPTLSTRGWVHI